MNILFVCTGNTCRSPMAERILRSIADEKGLKINVKSAGIAAFNGAAAADNAIKAMEKIKINIRDHTSTNLSEELIMDSNLILTMSKNHKDLILSNYPKLKDNVFTLKEFSSGEEGDIADPFGRSLKIYEDTRDEIAFYIQKFVDEREV